MSERLVTFKGWEGKWWKNIKPGRAALDAALTVLPGSGIAASVGKRIGGKLIRSGVGRVSRWFRRGGSPARGIGSKITKGPLRLGKTKLLPSHRPGVGTVLRAGAGAVAAVGVGRAMGVGKVVRPSAAVSAASRTQTQPSPARSSVGRTAVGTKTKRCGCPPGQRMLCFKRRHNPEAIAKRKARAKAARAKSKSKTAKRHAREKAAVARRKRSRAARKARRLVRRRK